MLLKNVIGIGTYEAGIVEVTRVITKENREDLEYKGAHCEHICLLQVEQI